jgi:phosphoglycolate phosphatase-like HAD superfamily hydrolase
MTLTAILDVDGTLVDSNYHHTVAWYRAFRDNGIVLPMWRIHRHQGMGGDQLVPALIGDERNEKLGEAIRNAEKDLYGELIDEIEPVDGARDLIVKLSELGHFVVLASSAKKEEVEHYLDLLDVEDDVDAWTSSADVDATKPEPDLVQVALDKGPNEKGIMVGDTIFDIEAAARIDMKSIAVMTGGVDREELVNVGATLVFDSVRELAEDLAETPFGS